MQMTLFFRFLCAVLLFAVAWIDLSSNALAHGIYVSGTRGNDISFPQCHISKYPQDARFAIVGVAGGRAFTPNPCLAKQFTWASTLSEPASLYMNLNAPIGPTAYMGMTGRYGKCPRENKSCQAKKYGYNAALDAARYAASQG